MDKQKRAAETLQINVYLSVWFMFYHVLDWNFLLSCSVIHTVNVKLTKTPLILGVSYFCLFHSDVKLVYCVVPDINLTWVPVNVKISDQRDAADPLCGRLQVALENHLVLPGKQTSQRNGYLCKFSVMYTPRLVCTCQHTPENRGLLLWLRRIKTGLRWGLSLPRNR